MEVFLSGLSAFFTMTALGMFAHAILKKKSRPYLLAWIIRILLVAVAFLSQAAAGATYSLAMSGSQLIGGVFIICLIGYMQRRVGRLGRSDWLAMSAAGVGGAIWTMSGDPLYGLLGAMLADTTATALGVHAGIVRGTHDSLAFWMCAFVATLMAALAVGNPASGVVILAPIFSCLNAVVNIMAWWYIRQRGARRIKTAEPLAISDFDAV